MKRTKITKKIWEEKERERAATRASLFHAVAGKDLGPTLAALMDVYCCLTIECATDMDQVKTAAQQGVNQLATLEANFAGRQMFAMTEKAGQGLSS